MLFMFCQFYLSSNVFQVSNLDVNKLSQLPMLAVLDVQNNALQMVPPELGNLTNIRTLQLEGNMFRSEIKLNVVSARQYLLSKKYNLFHVSGYHVQQFLLKVLLLS